VTRHARLGAVILHTCDLREDRVGALAHDIPGHRVLQTLFHIALQHLYTFTNEHLVHWFECLSVYGKLETGLNSLARANSLTVSA
jgi:hypothetical protein